MNTTTHSTMNTTMNAATTPSDPARGSRLLVLDDTGAISETHMHALPELLAPGDLLIVNDAATKAASLHLTTADGHDVEARLFDDTHAVLFGTGDWRDDTDTRPPPPLVHAGDVLRTSDGGVVTVESVSARSPRIVRLSFSDGASPWGVPVQYSYMADDVALDEVQTPYASRPWASEMPSAGRTLCVSVLVSLLRRGVKVARLTAAAGLSATGDASLDALLPLPERVQIPKETWRAVIDTRERGGRVIAVGTSTVRALESAARSGVLDGEASLILDEHTERLVTDGVLSGMHEKETSHDALLRAFASGAAIDALVDVGRSSGFRIHEHGDHCLIFAPRPR